MKKGKVAPSDTELLTEEPETLRMRIKKVIDGKYVTLVMACVTIWVLFGDDIRLVTTRKESDEGFFVSFLICFILFVLEIIINSTVQEDYKFTFFFWLDIVATFSIIPDIPYIMVPFLSIFEIEQFVVDVDWDTPSLTNTTLANYNSRVLRSIRYLRLVRIVKLYKYFMLTMSKREQVEKVKQEPTDMDPTELGKKLSDTITRRVIIGVLSMLLILPILQYQPVNHSRYYGLQQIFWAGRSACTDESQFGCNNNKPWFTEEGWYDLIYRYSKCSEDTEGDTIKFPLLWLRAPDYMQGGQINTIESVPEWEQDEDCAGKTVPDECSYRNEEMELQVYTPHGCLYDDPKGCEELQAYARFNMRSIVKDEAQMSMFVTLFVGVILAAGSVLFAYDSQKIVIKPVNKMVMVVKTLAEEPLRRDDDDTRAPSRDNMLEETIDKIGSLLFMGFGKYGSKIISQNLVENGQLNLMRTGTYKRRVIAIVRIKQFTDVIDCLQEEVLVFLNKIGKIVHTCAARWGGRACGNDMGAFIILWKNTEATEALIAMIKVVAEIQRAVDIAAYKSHPKIKPKFNDKYAVSLGIALHIGRIVQGPIGTDHKIDAGFLSPQVEFVEKLLDYIEEFKGMSILMTEHFYGSLITQAKNNCRKVDTLLTEYDPQPFALYSFDMDEVILPENKRADHTEIGEVILKHDMDTYHDLAQLFILDYDISEMHKKFGEYELFNMGLEQFVKGNWSDALALLKKYLYYKPDDGFSNSLCDFIESTPKVPDDWEGYRLFY